MPALFRVFRSTGWVGTTADETNANKECSMHLTVTECCILCVVNVVFCVLVHITIKFKFKTDH